MQENGQDAPKPKPKDKNYFNKDTEDSIVKFQAEPDANTRKTIFVIEIKPAFDKLIENIVNVYRFHSIPNIDILRYDCLSMLFENIYKFDATKGHRAFSYFNVIAKNWFIQRGKLAKKHVRDVDFDANMLKFLETNTEQLVVLPHEDSVVHEEFYRLLKEDIRIWANRFTKPQERVVLEAVMHLLENPDDPAIYSKKGIYLYLREITNLNTKQIVTNLTKFRKRYAVFKKKYIQGKI